jgi:hypothetical protein
VTLLNLANSSHKELDTLLSIALSQELEEPLKAVFLYTYVEKVSAEVIEASGERKLRRLLCKMSSKRRVGRALAILRREGVLSDDEYRELKRVFRALRCMRNSFLHRVCSEECPAINFNDAINAVQLYTSRAREFISKIFISWSTV